MAPCPHGRVRSRCKECGGSGIYEHGRQRRRCKDCGGCKHGRLLGRCKDCDVTILDATEVEGFDWERGATHMRGWSKHICPIAARTRYSHWCAAGPPARWTRRQARRPHGRRGTAASVRCVWVCAMQPTRRDASATLEARAGRHVPSRYSSLRELVRSQRQMCPLFYASFSNFVGHSPRARPLARSAQRFHPCWRSRFHPV